MIPDAETSGGGVEYQNDSDEIPRHLKYSPRKPSRDNGNTGNGNGNAGNTGNGNGAGHNSTMQTNL